MTPLVLGSLPSSLAPVALCTHAQGTKWLLTAPGMQQAGILSHVPGTCAVGLGTPQGAAGHALEVKQQLVL